MADQQSWDGTPQEQNQYGQPQGGYVPQQAAPQKKGSGLVALRPLFTPMNVGIGAGVLFLLTVLSYWLSWKRFSEDGNKATFNGFGIQKVSGHGDMMRNLEMGPFFLGLFVVLLIASAAVLAATTAYQKIAALCLVVAGGIGLLYPFIGLFSDFGMDKSFFGSSAGPDDDAIDWGLSFGIFIALVISLVTLAFGILYFLCAQGPLLPTAAPTTPANGLAAVLRPVYVAGGTVVLFLLLVPSYILDWRTAGDNRGEFSVNGLGLRTTKFNIFGETGVVSDVNLFPLLTATLTFALILLGALVLSATAWKKIGGVLIAAGAALALLAAFIGLVSEYGLFHGTPSEDMGAGYTLDTSASVGVFLALFVSLVLLVVAMLYLLVQFGLLGGAKQQQFGQQFGQVPQGQPGQPGQPQWNQYGQAPQQPQQGQQYPPQDPGQDPGQIPPAPGRW